MDEQRLRKEFIRALPERLAGLEEAYDRHNGDDLSGEQLALMHRLSHNLAGAGAIYGFMDVSDSARQLELALRTLMRKQNGVAAGDVERLGALLEGVREEVIGICL